MASACGGTDAHSAVGPAARSSGKLAPLLVSPTGSDGNPCSAASPCQSFQRAYDVAQPGQVVLVAGGNYPQEAISGTKTGPKVVFRPAAGAVVNVDWFSIHASQLEVRDLTAGGFDAFADSNGFTARNLDIGPFYIYGSSNISIIGGDIGPSYNPGGTTPVAYIAYGDGPDGSRVAPHNVLIDGALFHDFRRGSPLDHMEWLQVSGGDGITIRNSRFTHCDIFDIFFTEWSGPAPPKNILLENDFFDVASIDGVPGNTYYSLRFSDNMSQYENITMRYDSFAQQYSIDVSPVINFQITANVGPFPGCVEGIVYSHNVWDKGRCGATDRQGKLGFVDQANFNLHLARGSAAIRAGDPKDFPRDDIDGDKRPTRVAPDAGADQHNWVQKRTKRSRGH